MSNLEEAQKFKTLGNEAFQDGLYEESIKHFTKAIELNPDDHIFYSNRSGSYASLKKYKEALQDAEKCVSMKPTWPKGYTRKGLAEFYLHKYDESIASYKKVLEIEPTNTQAQEGVNRAEEEKANKQSGPGAGGAGGPGGFNQQQQQEFLQRLQQNPKTKEYLKDPSFIQKLTMIQQNPQMLMAYMNDPKVSEAIKVMFGLPDNMDFSKMGGQGGADDFPEEKDEDEKGEEAKFDAHHGHHHDKPQPSAYEYKKPSDPVSESEAKKNLGNEEFKKKNFAAAIEYYDQAITLNPTDVLYYNNKAACYCELKEYDQAMACVDKALEVAQESQLKDFSKWAKLYARKANVYTYQEKYDLAIQFYEKSLLEDKVDKVKQDLKKVEKLKKDWETSQYINPEQAEVHNELGKKLFLEGKYPEALKEYQEAIRRNPKDAKLYSNEASCYQKLMEFPHALKAIDKCLELDPNFVKAYAKKGNIHQGLHEYHKAIEVFEKGLKLDPENQECKDGLVSVNKKMYTGSETKQEAEERARHAMADPEIQNILRDPQIMTLLRNMQENPYNPENQKMLSDPKIMMAVQKLMQAGILKTQ